MSTEWKGNTSTQPPFVKRTLFYFSRRLHIPIPSMYGVFTYIWLMFIVNVGKYTRSNPCYGIPYTNPLLPSTSVFYPPPRWTGFPVFLGKVDIGKLPLLHSLLRAYMARWWCFKPSYWENSVQKYQGQPPVGCGAKTLWLKITSGIWNRYQLGILSDFWTINSIRSFWKDGNGSCSATISAKCIKQKFASHLYHY